MEEITGTLHDPGLGKEFLDTIPKAQSKKRNDQNLKFCSSRMFSREWKEKQQIGREYLQITFDKGLVSKKYILRIYKIQQ